MGRDTLKIIAEGLRLPEGPVVLDDGSVLVVEVLGGTLKRVYPDGKVEIVADLGGGPNGAAIGPDGRCYVCNNGGFASVEMNGMILPSPPPEDTPPGSIQVVDLKTGAFSTLYAHCEETPFWGPNDLVFDSAGGFWFTDFGRDRGRWHSHGSVYYAKADGSEIREVLSGTDSANGIGLSPDERTLYVALTMEGHVRAFDIASPGKLASGASWFDRGRNLGRAGAGDYLDSLAVDSKGNVCVASPGQGAILIFPPEGGSPRKIETGDFMTTNIAFGGKDLRTAYVTLGATGKLGVMEWECPGQKLAF